LEYSRLLWSLIFPFMERHYNCLSSNIFVCQFINCRFGLTTLSELNISEVFTLSIVAYLEFAWLNLAKLFEQVRKFLLCEVIWQSSNDKVWVFLKLWSRLQWKSNCVSFNVHIVLFLQAPGCFFSSSEIQVTMSLGFLGF
jgi:hypothetical protein